MESMRVSSTDVKLKPVVHHPRGYPIEEELFLQAVRAGKYRLVTQILAIHTEIDIDQMDKDGRTALLISVQIEDYEVRTYLVKLLLRHNADVNKVDKEGLSPLMHACKSPGKVDTVRSLIKQPTCAINLQDKHGNTALTWAVKADNWGAVRVIVNSKFTKSSVNVWSRDKEGFSPLEIAIDNNFTDTCWVLLDEAKADVSKLTSSYRTKLTKISKEFPEVYKSTKADSDDNNNNKNKDVAIDDTQKLPSNRTELRPLCPSPSSTPTVAMLTPIDGDLTYARKLPKLPAIANTNHS